MFFVFGAQNIGEFADEARTGINDVIHAHKISQSTPFRNQFFGSQFGDFEAGCQIQRMHRWHTVHRAGDNILHDTFEVFSFVIRYIGWDSATIATTKWHLTRCLDDALKMSLTWSPTNDFRFWKPRTRPAPQNPWSRIPVFVRARIVLHWYRRPIGANIPHQGPASLHHSRLQRNGRENAQVNIVPNEDCQNLLTLAFNVH